MIFIFLRLVTDLHHYLQLYFVSKELTARHEVGCLKKNTYLWGVEV